MQKYLFSTCAGIFVGSATTIGYFRTKDQVEGGGEGAKAMETDIVRIDPVPLQEKVHVEDAGAKTKDSGAAVRFDALETKFSSLKYGIPVSHQIFTPNDACEQGFVSMVDFRLRAPLWVAEHLTRSSVCAKEGDRKHSRFHGEDSVPEPFRASLVDFRGSGFSRGHLSPASNNKASQEAMDRSFSFANVVPQEMSMNGCDWLRLERMTQQLVKGSSSKAKRPPLREEKEGETSKKKKSARSSSLADPPFTDAFVISGPLFLEDNVSSELLPTGAPDNHRVAYRTVGPNRVAVPSHMYKVILAENTKDRTRAIAAFVMPNCPIKKKRPLRFYQVPIERLESVAGLRFFHRLLADERRGCADLCGLPGNYCSYGDDDRSIFWRRLGILKAADSIAEADTALSDAEQAGFDVEWMRMMFQRAHASRLADLAEASTEKEIGASKGPQ